MGKEIKQEIKNFGRFYSSFRRMTIYGDPEDVKKQLVLQYTSGRTESLKEMTGKEYRMLCEKIEEMNGGRDELKRRRSITLKLMQELGVDTTDWTRINDFCRHPRITGKMFRELSIEELIGLATKLRGMKRKGWQQKELRAEAFPAQRVTYLMDLNGFCTINLN